jgi:hypothetical protein
MHLLEAEEPEREGEAEESKSRLEREGRGDRRRQLRWGGAEKEVGSPEDARARGGRCILQICRHLQKPLESVLHFRYYTRNLSKYKASFGSHK